MRNLDNKVYEVLHSSHTTMLVEAPSFADALAYTEAYLAEVYPGEGREVDSCSILSSYGCVRAMTTEELKEELTNRLGPGT